MLSGTDNGETPETVYLQLFYLPSAGLQSLGRKLVSTYYYVEAYLRQVPSQKLTRLPLPVNLTRDLQRCLSTQLVTTVSRRAISWRV